MKKSCKFKLRITYNSPVILTFCLICTLFFVLDKLILPKENLILNYFTVPGSSKSPVPFNFKSVIDYVKLFTHVLGHADWSHLVGNLSFILLIGPLLEERYGSAMLVVMICVTALVTGVLNACLIPSSLLGSSGIAFMLIILASFTGISKNEIPLSFILVFILFLGSEIFIKKDASNISVLAHVAGGLCGSMFGFLIAPKKKPVKREKKSSVSDVEFLDEGSLIDEGSPRFKNSKFNKKKTATSDSTLDETVIGTFEI